MTKTLAAGFVLFAGLAVAQTEATDPNVIARHDLMKGFGAAAKTLGGMAGDKIPYDAAAAEAAKAALVTGSAEIGAKFEVNAVDADSEAKPEVWTNWEKFLANAKALNEAATALDTSSAASIGPGMGEVGRMCKDCHTTFRM